MNGSAWNDDQILRGLFNHEDSAVSYMYTAYWPVILGFVILNNGTEADAKDLFQDSMLDFLEQVWTGNLVLTCKLRTYLYTICRYKWLGKLRKRVPVADIEEYEEKAEEQMVFEEPAPELPDKEQLASAVNQLGEPCKSLLIGFIMRVYRWNRLLQNWIIKALRWPSNRSSAARKG